LTLPVDWRSVWQSIRSVLEAFYFLAGISVGTAAWFVLKQVRLASDQLITTKQIAEKTALREAVKLASDQLKYFTERVVPAQTEAVNKYKVEHCTFLTPDPVQPGVQPVPAFVVNANGDFAQANFNLAKITPEQWERVKMELVVFANSLENYAVPFAAGVADDATGFQETAPVFLSVMQTFMPVFYYLRSTQGARYASALKLFNIWNTRIAANVLAQVLPGIQKMIQGGQSNQIPPI